MNEPYDKKKCACCGVNGTVRKYTLVFKYSNSARCCYYCIEKLGGVENARMWLEQHALFNGKGEFWFERAHFSDILLKPLLITKSNYAKA